LHNGNLLGNETVPEILTLTLNKWKNKKESQR